MIIENEKDRKQQHSKYVEKCIKVANNIDIIKFLKCLYAIEKHKERKKKKMNSMQTNKKKNASFGMQKLYYFLNITRMLHKTHFLYMYMNYVVPYPCDFYQQVAEHCVE